MRLVKYAARSMLHVRLGKIRISDDPLLIGQCGSDVSINMQWSEVR